MTMHKVVLCADEECVRNPSLMGLEGESLESQDWLRAISGAQQARDYVAADDGADEVWVVSSDEVDPINLAATLKRDSSDKTVCLVAWRETGSLLSRASAAGIDEVISSGEMARRYLGMKRSYRDNPRRRRPRHAAGGISPEFGGSGRPAPEEAQERVLRVDENEAAQDGEVAAKAPGGSELEDAWEPSWGQDGKDAREADAGGEREAARTTMASGKRGYALTVVSAGGGAGKSTVAVLSALIAASHGYKTLLIDADLQFGDAAIMLGDEEALPISQVLSDPACMEDQTPSAGRPLLVCAPERLEQYELFQAQMPGLVDRARESFDVVVVNTGSFWAESHIQLMEASTNTLFLMDQRPTSVKAVRRALELCARCGVASHPFLFAVNRCSRNSLLSSIDVSCALNGVPVAELKDGGGEVAELTGAGLAGRLVDERNELCVSLNDFLGRVIPPALGEAPPPDAPSRPKGKRKSFRKKGKVACL